MTNSEQHCRFFFKCTDEISDFISHLHFEIMHRLKKLGLKSERIRVGGLKVVGWKKKAITKPTQLAVNKIFQNNI